LKPVFRSVVLLSDSVGGAAGCHFRPLDLIYITHVQQRAAGHRVARGDNVESVARLMAEHNTRVIEGCAPNC